MIEENEAKESSQNGFSAPTAARLTGNTYASLDRWARSGLVIPSVRESNGTGKRRRYSFDDLVRLHVLSDLKDIGCKSIKVCNEVLKKVGHKDVKVERQHCSITVRVWDIIDKIRKEVKNG